MDSRACSPYSAQLECYAERLARVSGHACKSTDSCEKATYTSASASPPSNSCLLSYCTSFVLFLARKGGVPRVVEDRPIEHEVILVALAEEEVLQQPPQVGVVGP